MPKYTPIKLTQLSANESAAVDVINQNLDSIKENIDDSISRSAKTPSQLVADLDLNGHKILNIGKPVADTDVVRLQDVVENKAEIKQMYDQVMATGERILSAAEVTDEKVQEAADYAAASQNWATKTDGPVADSNYSAKYYASQVESIGTEITTVAGIASDVTAVAGNATNINAVNANKTNIDAVADNSSNINTVASNVSDIGTCADNMSAITDAPTQASNAAGSANAAAASAEQAAQSAAVSNPPPLLSHQWADHLLNDIRYLRADTFSWQSGLVYAAAYNHLVNDLVNNQTINVETLYCWDRPSKQVYTTKENPSIGDIVYVINNGVVEFASTIRNISETTIYPLGMQAYIRNSDGDINNQNIPISPQTETIGSYTILYYLAEDGHKITTDETNVDNIYNESGVAWYYILDTANQRFKLPRTKYGFAGLRDAVGKYVEAGLPDILIDDACAFGETTPALNYQSGMYYLQNTLGSRMVVGVEATTRTDWWHGQTKVSTQNSIYGNSTTVQPPATQMYLYFYVGNFTQTATEQTAGLNSELFNGKVDLNAANLSTQGKSLISGLGMPSDRYDDLTLGASGATYTAPANGCFVLDKRGTAQGEYLCGLNQTTNWRVCTNTTNNYAEAFIFIPCNRGEICEIQYTAGGTVECFRFHYFKGDSNV